MKLVFYKKKPTDKIYWAVDLDFTGTILFSFDRKKVFNYWSDYPDKLTKGQKRQFDKENPFWRDFNKLTI